MNKRWQVHLPDPLLRNELAGSLQIHPITAQLLVNRWVRSVEEARQFLSPSLSKIPDPFLLKGMEEAVRRLAMAFRDRERVLIWGDYDVDGITAAALLSRTLSALGFDTLQHIPHRLTEGYGLNRTAITAARRRNVKVIVSVDCGITAHGAAGYLQGLGMDLILTDHHEPKATLPEAYAILNPLQKGCRYPFKFLSGAGLAFKLAQGLIASTFPQKRALLLDLLDLVAIGTIADIVPIVGENRVLIQEGLRLLARTQKPGLKALLKGGGAERGELSPRDVALGINPRINVSGRLGSAATALHLLLTENPEEAQRLAKALESGNKSRRTLETQMIREALAKLSREVNFKEQKVIVLHDERWHPGVVGIVASRIMHQFYRPTLIIGFAGGIGRGSARSIEGFHLFEALGRCREYLDEFGGHRLACGFTVRKENLIPFAESIQRIAHESLSSEDLVPLIEIDMELSLGQLSPEFLEELERLEPFGAGNARPVFLSRDVGVEVTGTSRGTLHLALRQERGPFLQASCPADFKSLIAALPQRQADCVFRISPKRDLTLLDLAPSRI